MIFRYTLCLIFCFLCWKNGQAQNLKVIIMADVQALDIGMSCLKDVSVMNSVFKGIAQDIHYGYDVAIITQQRFSKKELDMAIKKLSVTPEDVIVFYYSGHGFALANTKSSFPLLYLQDSRTTNIEDIHAQLVAKGARLCISLADCCNNIVLEKAVISPPPIVTRGFNTESDILRILFKESKGDVLIASAKREERAGGLSEIGGFYSFSWNEALTQAVANNLTISWDSFLNDAEQRLQKQLAGYKSKRSQHSQWRINTTPSNPTKVVHPTTDNTNPIIIKPLVSFSEMNKFLNTLADEKISYDIREKLLEQGKNQYFSVSSQAKEYINIYENNMAATPIDLFLNSLLINANLIKHVNVVEKLSEFTSEGLYRTITVQEIR